MWSPSLPTSGTRGVEVVSRTVRRGGVLVAALLVLLHSGCLYSFRAGTGFPSHIRTMAVIPFDNQTTRFELTQELHEQLLRELPRSLGVRPASEETADAVVRGTISTYTLGAPLYRQGAGGDRAEVVVRQVNLVVAVEIVDRVENVILWDSRSLSGRGEFLDAEPEDRGRDEAIRSIVRQIVDGAQSNW